MRRPVSAKKMALISSDLPRENSATKATHELLVAEALAQRRELLAGGAVGQVVLGEEAGQSRRRVRSSAARQSPRASRLVANEWRHRGCAKGASIVAQRAPARVRAETLAHRAQARTFRTRGARRCAARHPAQRRWQPGRRTSRAAPWTMRRIVAAAARARLAGAAVDARLRAGTRRRRRGRRGSRARSSRRARRARASVARTAAASRSARGRLMRSLRVRGSMPASNSASQA